MNISQDKNLISEIKANALSKTFGLFTTSGLLVLYILFVLHDRTIVEKVSLSSFVLISAPFFVLYPEDISLRIRATMMSRANGAGKGSLKERSKTGILPNGQLVSFVEETILTLKRQQGVKCYKGRIQTMPAEQKSLALHEKMQRHLYTCLKFREKRGVYDSTLLIAFNYLMYTHSLSIESLTVLETAILLNVWLVVTILFRNALFEAFFMKGQKIFPMRGYGLGEVTSSFHDDGDVEVAKHYLKNNGYKGYPKAVMLDGSMLIGAVRADEHEKKMIPVEYILVSRK